MKIALVFDGLDFGGIERVGIDYIRILLELGHEITIYNLTPHATALEQEIKGNVEIRHSKFPRKICPYMYTSMVKRWGWGKYAYPFAFLGLNLFHFFNHIFQADKNNKYDVAIAFSGHFNDLTFIEKNYVKANKKVCWLHGGILDYALMSSGFLLLYKNIKNLVTLSSDYQETVFNSNKFLEGLNVKKIYNPTYVEERKVDGNYVKELTEKYGDFILMVGRFTQQKDQITVIRAIQILKDKYGIYNNCLFVGDGEKRAQAEMFAKELHVDQQVIFAGSRYDVQNYYSAAKVFVHSSPAEGLPTVLLEAMEFGVPIVATNSLPGVPEILEGSRNGLVCEVGDAEKMAEYIHKLLTDDNCYKNYAALGRERIKKFKPDYIAEEMKDFLDHLYE